MRIILKTVLLAGILVVGLGIVQAQDAKPLPRHPGELIKYQIKFDGPNADRIKTVNANLSLRIQGPKDQAGFNGGMQTNGIPPSTPRNFELTFKVPENAANGDYFLSFSALADEGYGNYTDGQEFNVPPVRVENPKKFTPPEVTVTPLP